MGASVNTHFNAFLLSLCGILCLTALCAVFVATGTNHGLIYTAIVAIGGLAGFDVWRLRKQLSDTSSKK